MALLRAEGPACFLQLPVALQDLYSQPVSPGVVDVSVPAVFLFIYGRTWYLPSVTLTALLIW